MSLSITKITLLAPPFVLSEEVVDLAGVPGTRTSVHGGSGERTAIRAWGGRREATRGGSAERTEVQGE